MSNELVAYLSADATDWRNGFQEANSVLDQFSGRFENSLNHIATTGREMGVVATSAGASLWSLAAGLTVIGGSAGGLFSVARSLFSIGSASSNVATSINSLKSGTSYIQKITGVISGIGAAATISALGLRGISYAMAQLGRDTTRVDALAKTIGRVGLAATVAVIGVKSLAFSLSTLRSVAGGAIGIVTSSFVALRNIILTIPSAVVRTGMAIRGLGGAAVGSMRSGANAISAFAATAGDSLSEVHQGLVSVASGFAIGGIVGGLATAAGLALAARGSFSSLIPQTLAASDGLKQINGWLAGIRSWLVELKGGLATQGPGALAEMAQRGAKYFEAFLNATQPLTDAIQNVWLPAVKGSTQEGESSFAKFFNFIESSFGQWVFDSIALLSDFVGNFDLYFQIAQQSIVLWASNGMLQVGDFFSNIGTWLEWFQENWFKVFMEIGNIQQTIFGNIFKNLKENGAALWEWLKGGMTGEFNFNFTGLTDGFKSVIDEWPDLIKTELADSTPELEGLFDQLGKRQKDAAERGLGFGQEFVFAQGSGGEEAKKQKTAGLSAFAMQGSHEAYSSIARAVSGNGETPMERKQDVANKHLSDIAKNINKIAADGPSQKGPSLRSLEEF